MKSQQNNRHLGSWLTGPLYNSSPLLVLDYLQKHFVNYNDNDDNIYIHHEYIYFLNPLGFNQFVPNFFH